MKDEIYRGFSFSAIIHFVVAVCKYFTKRISFAGIHLLQEERFIVRGSQRNRNGGHSLNLRGMITGEVIRKQKDVRSI